MLDRCKHCKFKEGYHSTTCQDYKTPKAAFLFTNEKTSGIYTAFEKIAKRAAICLIAIILSIVCFYLSLVFTSDSLTVDQSYEVARSVRILKKAGFADEVFYLNKLAVFRKNDNWLNASISKENAYAATNYPFEIVTIYQDFFSYPIDETERAAILLHEAKHLQGEDEKVAYEFVWKNKKRFGWTKEKYGKSVVWREIRKQTREYAPNLFVCDFNEFNDCTE